MINVIDRYQIRGLLFMLAALSFSCAFAEPAVPESTSTVRSLDVAGNTAFSAAELLQTTGLQKGTTFQAGDEIVAAGLVRSYYQRSGYLEAKSSGTATSTDTGWTVRVDVQEGPLYRFGDTHYEGLDKLPARVPRFEQRYKKGDPYVRSKLFETQTGLYGTGFYEDVSISASTNTQKTADVYVRFREKPYKWLKGGVGWGSEERQRVTLLLEHDNLFRRAYHGQIAGTWSAIWREYSAEFVNPYFFSTRTEFRNSALWRQETRKGYVFERTRGETGFGRQLTPRIKGSITARIDRNIVYDLDPNIAATTPALTDSRALALGFNRDTANDFFFPTRGARTQLSLERFGSFLGGQLDLHRVSVQSFHYHPLGGPFIGALALRGGVISPYGRSNEVPIYERFFFGGANSVRGYDERGVGPKSVDQSPLGGRRQLGSSIETRFPLFWRLRGALFVDGGQVGDRWSQVFPRLWKYSAGGGIRFVTPVGPFRLDAGYKLNRDPGDLETWRIHFSLGESF